MRGTVRGLVLGAATALVVIPFVAIAQEVPPEPDRAAPPEAATARPERVGPPWYDGPPHTGEGPPPWAPAHGRRAQLDGWQGGGPPPSVGADRRAGPPWYDGPPHTGEGPPPWAGRGGPHGAARGAAD